MKNMIDDDKKIVPFQSFIPKTADHKVILV